MGMISFYLPGFFDRMHLQLVLHAMMEKYPEVFYENIRIGAVYGTFPGCIWNGGRTVLGSCSMEQAEYVLSEFNSRGIPLRFTFTNALLSEEHLSDPFCNAVLERACEGSGAVNEVLVNSPLLEAHIRKNYPDLPLISSTTKQLRSREELEKELEKDYKLIVVYKALNRSKELFLLPQKERFEILVDSFCMDNCPKSAAHYREASLAQLESREPVFEGCRAINRDFYDFTENESFITAEELYGRYHEAGFSHFKLDGRTFTDADVIESYMYYMIKPEARDRARLTMHKTLEKLRRI